MIGRPGVILRLVIFASVLAALAFAALRRSLPGAEQHSSGGRSGSSTAAGTTRPLAGVDSIRYLRAYPAELPEGRGRDRVMERCLMCHSAMLITQQHKDAAAWEKTLALMEAWGGVADSSSRPELKAYLVAHFGPLPDRGKGAAPSGSK